MPKITRYNDNCPFTQSSLGDKNNFISSCGHSYKKKEWYRYIRSKEPQNIIKIKGKIIRKEYQIPSCPICRKEFNNRKKTTSSRILNKILYDSINAYNKNKDTGMSMMGKEFVRVFKVYDKFKKEFHREWDFLDDILIKSKLQSYLLWKRHVSHCIEDKGKCIIPGCCNYI
tara:strand:- start:647 stop:1159 length:513 start_codon:yes stop_codon:yes gene_type:complete